VQDAPLAAALTNAGVVMSLFVYFMGSGTPTSIIVIMVTSITILQQSLAGRGAAFGLVIGNIAGGLAATIAYLMVSLLPNPAFLFLVLLFFGLVFARKIAESGQMAPVYVVGAATFLGPRLITSASGQRHVIPVPSFDRHCCFSVHIRRRKCFAFASR
jgi:hypothetical protein